MEQLKTCSKCGEIKTVHLFYSCVHLNSFSAWCKDCVRKRSDESNRKRKEKNTPDIYAYKREQRKRAQELTHKQILENRLSERKNLTDSYIRNLLIRNISKHITKELIELHRQHLKVNRLIKEKTK